MCFFCIAFRCNFLVASTPTPLPSPKNKVKYKKKLIKPLKIQAQTLCVRRD